MKVNQRRNWFEGKTTVITNLGLAIAQQGTKTLLVSSDLRRPKLCKTFGVNRVPGLYEVVSGTASLEDAIKDISDIILGDIEIDEIIKSPGIENIRVLPSGHTLSNPAEILGSQKMSDLIKELKKRFDIVLFDAPPVLPVTDACLLASQVDSVILCYEIGRTARNTLIRAKAQLESMDAKISGIVLNHIKLQTETRESYPHYYRYYGKEETDKKKGNIGEKDKGDRVKA